jgi:hypothetical protein
MQKQAEVISESYASISRCLIDSWIVLVEFVDALPGKRWTNTFCSFLLITDGSVSKLIGGNFRIVSSSKIKINI